MIKKIPTNDMPLNYYEHNFIDSPLIEVPKNIGILIDLQYPIMSMDNSINKCLVRKEVLEKLLEAKTYLPKGITFKIWDAYRPMALQKELFDKYKNQIIDEFNLMQKSEEERNKILNSYVAIPSDDENFPPQHTTGGAVDITLAYEDTKETLDLGIPFDSFSSLTNTDAFEKKGMNKEIRKNRRILYNAMTKAGFTNLPSECWHFDYGNRNWAYYNKKPAIYKGIFSLDNIEKKNK